MMFLREEEGGGRGGREIGGRASENAGERGREEGRRITVITGARQGVGEKARGKGEGLRWVSAKERTPFRGKFPRDARHTVHLCKLIFRVYTALPLPAPSPFPPSGPSSRYTPVAVSRHVAVSRDRNNHRERTPRRERSTAGDLLLLRVCHLLGCWDLRPFFLSLSPLSLSLSSLPSHPSDRKTRGLGRCRTLPLDRGYRALFYFLSSSRREQLS